MVIADLTDVTLVSDDTFSKIYWWDSGEWGWCTRGDAPEVFHIYLCCINWYFWCVSVVRKFDNVMAGCEHIGSECGAVAWEHHALNTLLPFLDRVGKSVGPELSWRLENWQTLYFYFCVWGAVPVMYFCLLTMLVLTNLQWVKFWRAGDNTSTQASKLWNYDPVKRSITDRGGVKSYWRR